MDTNTTGTAPKESTRRRGRPRATGPCKRCGAEDWLYRDKIVRGHVVKDSRHCLPCKRAAARRSKRAS